MTDAISKSARSRNMSAIKSVNTKPELLVRSLVHRLGYRYRLHAKDLPGKPDLVFQPPRKVIFVHGCFWHQHAKLSCKDGRAPQSNLGYWAAKLARNVTRDARNIEALKALGFGVLVIWECEITKLAALEKRLHRFLG